MVFKNFFSTFCSLRVNNIYPQILLQVPCVCGQVLCVSVFTMPNPMASLLCISEKLSHVLKRIFGINTGSCSIFSSHPIFFYSVSQLMNLSHLSFKKKQKQLDLNFTNKPQSYTTHMLFGAVCSFNQSFSSGS